MRRCGLLLAAGMLAFGFTAQAGDDDLHFQLKGGVSFKLNNVWKMTVTEEPYYSDSGRLFVHESDVGLEYSGLADWLALSLNFRYIESNSSGQNWIEEYRPHFNVKIKSKLGDFPWSNRTRIEYRDFKEKKDAWRLRNILIFEMPFEIPILKARPYIGDETLFTLTEKGFDQNRLYTGLKFKLLKNLGTNMYYYWGKSRKTGRWDELSVLGCELIYEF